MPGRRDLFLNKGIYHIYNKTIDSKRVFHSSIFAKLFLHTLYYYRSALIDRSFSHFKLLDRNIQVKQNKRLSFGKYFIVDILGFCLMPTHFHLIIQQITDNGIKNFLSNVMNSFTRYYNVKIHRKGPLFLPRFQSREIISDELLIHISRYQHLNPYSGGIVNSFEDLINYPWSSYGCYLNRSASVLVNTKRIMEMFGNDAHQYQAFVENQADYQRSLEELKYIEKWEF